MSVDLVLLSVGGVQRFIVESRSTADVAGASAIVQRLARCAATAVRQRTSGSPAPYGLIFPSRPKVTGISNKIAFVVVAGAGPEIARAAAAAVRAEWQALLAQTFAPEPSPPTPGQPDIAWVSVTGRADRDGYETLWGDAQREMVGRRRARLFEPIEWERRVLSAQSPGLPAVPAPPGSARHERDDKLSAEGWAKRSIRPGGHFPSTLSIASSAWRDRILTGSNPALLDTAGAAVDQLARAVKGLGVHTDRYRRASAAAAGPLQPLSESLGAWVYPEVWDSGGLDREHGTTADEATVSLGRGAARALAVAAEKAGIAPLSPYYAIVMQDLDRLGRALGGLGLTEQRAVSEQLGELAELQRSMIDAEHPLAVPVYAGGDDFLAFCPASTALPLVAAIRKQVVAVAPTGPLGTAGPDGTPITASTAVLFAHMSTPLQTALAAAREALDNAKSAVNDAFRSRDALAVVVRRRGGQRASTVQPWRPRSAADGADAVDLLQRVRPGAGVGELSAGLCAQLERDQAGLDELAGDPALRSILRAELRRLVLRHGGSPAAVDALYVLGSEERVRPRGQFRPLPAALVARFLTQEAL